MAATRGSWVPDLLAVGVAATVPAALVYHGVDVTAIRLAAGLPLVLFLPGYALVSALFPEAREDCDPPFTRETGEGVDRTMRTRVRGLTGVDRVGLAVALSAALVPGLALFHYVLGGSVAPLELAVGLAALTWAFVLVGLARRLRLPADHRFRVSLAWPAAWVRRYFVPESPHLRPSVPHEAADVADVALNVLLVCTLLVALTTATYAFTQPPPAQDYDELAVLTQDGDGEYVAGGYPSDLSGDDPLYVAVTNRRDAPRAYVLRGTLEVVDANGTVVDRDEQLRRTVELDAGDRTYVRHDPDPSLDGERLRVRYTLAFAAGDGTEAAHRSVHVWITGAPEGASTPAGSTPAPTPTPTAAGVPVASPTATPAATDDGIDIGF